MTSRRSPDRHRPFVLRHRSVVPGHRSAIAALALTVLLGVAGCAAEPLRSHGSMLDTGSDGGPGCLPAAGDVGYTLGAQVLRNLEASMVTITAVVPENPQNLTVLGTFLVPVTDGRSIASGSWPPAAAGLAGLPNPDLTSYTSLTVPPRSSSPGTGYDLVLHLAPVDTFPAGFDRLRIEYSADGREYYQTTDAALQITPGC